MLLGVLQRALILCCARPSKSDNDLTYRVTDAGVGVRGAKEGSVPSNNPRVPEEFCTAENKIRLAAVSSGREGAIGATAAAGAAACRCHTVAGAGHMLMLDQPTGFADVLMRILNEE